MQPGNDLTFGPFRLDVTQGQLWQGITSYACAPAAWRYSAIWPSMLGVR
jgi:hypothetical protein